MTQPNEAQGNEEQETVAPAEGERYVENPDHVPDPYAQYGTLPTTGVADDGSNDIRSISPVFDVGRAQNLQNALKALDPEDASLSPELVSLSDHADADEVRGRLETALAEYTEDPEPHPAVAAVLAEGESNGKHAAQDPSEA